MSPGSGSDPYRETFGQLTRSLSQAGVTSPQDGRCSELDALARCLDTGDGLLAVTGPGCDIAEGVVAAVSIPRIFTTHSSNSLPALLMYHRHGNKSAVVGNL